MRSRILKTIASAALFTMLCSATALAEQATVTGREVNVRTGPGMGYRVITSLPKGTTVEVISRCGDTWVAVRYGNETGYMSSAYLSFEGADTAGMPDIYLPEESSGDMPGVFLPEETGSSPTETATAGGSEKAGVIIAPESTPAPAAPESTPAPSGPKIPANVQTPPTIVTPVPYNPYNPSGVFTPGTTPVTAPSPTPAPTPTPTPTPSLIPPPLPEVTSAPQVTAAPVTTPVPTAAAEEPAQPVETYEQSRPGYITGNNVRFRSAPSLSGRILGEFYFSNAVEITGVSGEWTAVKARGQEGFVYSLYVTEGSYGQADKKEPEPANEKPQETAQSQQEPSAVLTASSGQEVADFAMQYLGYRYCWGGADPATGFDCSGFVYYVYSRFGYTLNRVAADQAKNGTAVSKDALQPGDILCFYSSGKTIGHSGIYIGDGKFIHSATSKTGVIITELSGNYEKRGYEARRIVN